MIDLLIFFSPLFSSPLYNHRFGASPHAPVACGAFAEGAWDILTKTEGTFEMTLLTQKKTHFKYDYTTL